MKNLIKKPEVESNTPFHGLIHFSDIKYNNRIKDAINKNKSFGALIFMTANHR